ncbi:hypothetical protein DH09_03755 [Bacillaceae bacterium JMAK1]|nr:hypothetical protein DH09_03755 [Bacillaceae bacterium JMAK1]
MDVLNRFGLFNVFIVFGGLVLVLLYVDFENPLVLDVVMLVAYALIVAMHLTRLVMILKNR